MTAHLPFILLALCAASSSAAAPPVVIAIEALGLTAEEEGALAGTLQRGVRQQQLEPVMLAGPLPEGCVGAPPASTVCSHPAHPRCCSSYRPCGRAAAFN